MSVTDEVSAVVGEHGAAVYAAARSLVSAGAEPFTVDVFRSVLDALVAGDHRPTGEVVREAFAAVSAAVQPQPPAARRMRAMRQLDRAGEQPPPWLVAAVADLRPAAGEPEPGPETASVAADWRPADSEQAPAEAEAAPKDGAWLPTELAAEPLDLPPAEAAQQWAPVADEPVAAAPLAPRRPYRRRPARAFAPAAAVLVLLAAGAFALTRGEDRPSPLPAAASQVSTATPGRPAETAADRRAERRRARAERHDAASQRRAAVAAHRKQTVRSFARAVRRARAAQAAAPAAPAAAAATPAAAPVTRAPAPAQTAAPPPQATSAPAEPPPSQDPPGRHAP